MKRTYRNDPELTVGLVTILAGLFGFVLITVAVWTETVQAVDERVVRALSPGIPGRLGGWPLEIGRDITALGGYAVLVLIVMITSIYLRLNHKTFALRFLLMTVIGGYALNRLLKTVIARSRPDELMHLSYVASKSFPSGHSMMSAIVYTTVGILLARGIQDRSVKRFVYAVPVGITVLVGISRVYLGVHYPTDVLAGWCCGYFWIGCCSLVARRLHMASGNAPPRASLEAQQLSS